MKKSIRFILLLTVVFLGLQGSIAALTRSDIKSNARLSKQVITMGDTTKLFIDFAGPIGQNFRLIDSALLTITDTLPDVEVTLEGNPVEKDEGNGFKSVSLVYQIQAFDSGLYSLPKVALLVGQDTVLSPTVALKVDPVELDSTLIVLDEQEQPSDLTVHPLTDVLNIEHKMVDYVPDWIIQWGWWVLLALVLISAGIYVYMHWIRHGRIPLIPQKKPVPPYDKAIQELTQLKEQQLWQRGSEKEYYTRLTDILREYLQGRFGINAMEMTSGQIMQALRSCAEAESSLGAMDELLKLSDFVKFAKARPLADDNERAYSDAFNFVETTRPVETHEEEENSQSGDEMESSDKDPQEAKDAKLKKEINKTIKELDKNNGKQI